MLFEDEKKKLIRDLTSYIQRHPEESADFMDAITLGLKKFRQGVQEERDKLAYQALSFSISFLDKKANARWHKYTADIKIPAIIDAMFLLAPRGLSGSFTEKEKELLDDFVNMCRKEDVLNNPRWNGWLATSKGPEYVEWMKKLLNDEGIK
jgi:hypothetical protein